LATKDRLVRSSSWSTSFFLFHDSPGVGERGFDQVVTQLHQLTRPIYQQSIGMFNDYSREPTHWSLTDTDRGYNLGGADLPQHTSRPSQLMVLHFPPKGPTRSQIIHPIITKRSRERTNINLASKSLHSTSTVSYHLSIVCANGNH
jgi:hypothetical protein